MGRRTGLEQILGWTDRLTSGLTAARTDHAASETLLASIEYELQQMRRQLSTVVLPPLADAPPAPVAPPPCGEGGAGHAFNVRLRHPESIRLRSWWAV
ncbi:MAG: hypothetical protein ACT4N2_14295 [Hyphomicrobium sp.]